ncbi:ATP-grasp domain-containing protein [Pelagicoccus mobilis]|uniref:ATP-grasp domain-containing protein n=1 Tax=Pelagicoccus mobilis TaxID=415221 RepID=A0A934VNV9_9BACT|nr:ATP-grasp domain-containing protein [Pelagicoccus mobilis]MBK1876637.1 ATP-grasp domain-containing protein [Pelagicoccus mobilis]
MKTVLILGGTMYQVPVIEYCKQKGYRAVTCDYIPSNPGHKYSDEYHNVSTTDIEGVLSLAKVIQADAIVAYASDPAAITAARVAQGLKLPGNSIESVEILSNKSKFRQFLEKNRFRTPKTVTIKTLQTIEKDVQKLSYPLIIKPVDSSGSKGVIKIDSPDKLSESFDQSIRFSRSGSVIIEEFIDKIGPILGGEVFIENGKRLASFLGDQLCDAQLAPYTPCGMIFPTRRPPEIQLKVLNTVETIVNKLGFSSGGVNIEFLIDQKGEPIVIEIGPRTGGNLLPELATIGTGFDFAGNSVETALGNKPAPLKLNIRDQNLAYYAVHTNDAGILKEVTFSDKLSRHISNYIQLKKRGDQVEPFRSANHSLGILLLKFDSPQDSHSIMSIIDKHINVQLEIR